MHIRAALFDLDNLLVDTEPFHFAAYCETMREYGIDMRSADRLEMIGVPGPVNIARTLLQYDRSDVDPAVASAKRQERYLELLKTQPIPIMPGALTVLEWLKVHNIPRIIASSSTRKQIETTVARTELKNYFEAYVSFEDVLHGKPHPDIYLEAARRLQVHPSESVAFDDAAAGIESAKAAGCYAIAVPNQYTERGDFSKANLVVQQLAEVDCAAIFIL